MASNSPFNILVVDDHALVREAFTSMLRTEFPHAKVVSAGTCAEAMAEARAEDKVLPNQLRQKRIGR